MSDKTFEEWRHNEYGMQAEYQSPLEIAALEVAFAAGGLAALAELGHCQCSMARKLTGDGCSVCNPTLKREVECYGEGVKDGIKMEREECAQVAIDYPTAAVLTTPCSSDDVIIVQRTRKLIAEAIRRRMG